MIPTDVESLVMTNLEPYDKNLKNTKEYVNAVLKRRQWESVHSGPKIE